MITTNKHKYYKTKRRKQLFGFPHFRLDKKPKIKEENAKNKILLKN